MTSSAFCPPNRVLMGPGPSDVPASVLRALAAPTIGHLDPAFLELMDEVGQMLRDVLGTDNRLTLPMSGTGSLGMETCLVNLIEPGDRVLVGVNGVFGTRMVEVAKRAGAEVTAVEADWGTAFDEAQFVKAAAGRQFKLLCVVHAETSTGVLQPLTPIADAADQVGAMLLVDAVTSLAGVPIEADEHRVDALYSGTQKCLSCPPGLAPVTFSERAESVLSSRSKPVQSWYADLNLIRNYWGSARAYHHTAPINMMYALHEALRLCVEEGLDERYARHALHGRALVAGLQAMDLQPRVEEAIRLPQLTTVAVPDGIDDAKVRQHLLQTYGLEIGGGLGPMKGTTWRIGLMGASATRRHVMLCLTALADALRAQGRQVADPVSAASDAY